MSPLADPVFGAICANAEVAGLAMESIIRITLEADNETLTGRVETVTPQQVHSSTRRRSCRVDIESNTNENERIITEVQMNPDSRIMIRNLFSSSHVFTESSDKGDTPSQMAVKLPRIIHINFLGYNIRNNSTNLIESFKIMYTNEPKETAISNFSGYNIQLPKVLEMKPDFSSNLYCWCYMLYTAHIEGKTVQEVVAMKPELQDYAKKDAGFQQFCDRYNFVSADPKTRNEYVLWVNDLMREEGEKEWAWQEGKIEGIKEGIKEGSKQQAMFIAYNMLEMNMPVEVISKATKLSLEEVEALHKNE